jgi:glucosamine-6-phosphate deaminase
VTFTLEVLPADRWADAVAAHLVARLRAEPGLRLCLPTGETPTPLYERLRRSDPAVWSRSTVVLLDEYLGLPPDDPAMAGPRLRRELLADVRPASYIDIDTARADEAAAASDLDGAAAAGIDLALLGLGLNGHIGLNEPGTEADASTRVVTLHPDSRQVATERYGASHAPERGITLGIGRLLKAREIWLLVTGERKADVLRRTLEGPETAELPASFLRRHPHCRVLADEPAAALLGEA